MAAKGIKEFTQVLGDFRSISSNALKGAVLVPLAGSLAKVGPPPKTTVALITCVTQLLLLMAIFQFYYSAPVTKLNRHLKIAIVVFFIGLLGSFMLMEFFTVSAGRDENRIIIGFEPRPEIVPLLRDGYSATDSLRDAEFRPDQVWTHHSLALMRVAVPAVWVATCAMLAVCIGLFVIAQRKKATRV
jgi:hypothetical protein